MKEVNRRDFIKTTGKMALGATVCGMASSLAIPARAFAAAPTVRLAYILSDHHAPLMVAAKNGDLFQQKFNTYLKPLTEGKFYELYADGARAAKIQLIPTKKGPDVEKLMAQGSADIAISGTQSIMLAVDKGVDTRLISPLQTAGNVFVIHKDQPIDSWEGFVGAVKNQGRQFKIGMPGPNTVSLIIFRWALDQVGVSHTEDAADKKADVLFINMKGHGNLVTALSNHITDGIIGAQPFPAVTIDQGVGRFILNIQDLPPEGQWLNHACCSLEVNGAFLKREPELATRMMMLLALGTEMSNTRKDMTAQACSEWLGVPASVEKVAMQSMSYTTLASERWRQSVAVYAQVMQRTGLFTGALRDAREDTLADRLFDFQWMEKARAQLKAKGHIA